MKPLAAVERGEVERGGKARPAEDHVRLPGKGTTGRGRQLGPEYDVSDPVAIDIATATGGSPEAVSRAEAGNDETVGAVQTCEFERGGEDVPAEEPGPRPKTT